MTTKDIQRSICRSEVLKGNLPCENIQFSYVSESDVLSLNKTGYTHEFEVKVSRSDFLADRSKKKWNHYANRNTSKRIPNYFSYACEPGLIQLTEIPEFAGLVYVSREGIQVMRRPDPLHKDKPDIIKLLAKFTRMSAERQYLGVCMLTYKNRQIKARRVA